MSKYTMKQLKAAIGRDILCIENVFTREEGRGGLYLATIVNIDNDNMDDGIDCNLIQVNVLNADNFLRVGGYSFFQDEVLLILTPENRKLFELILGIE